MTDALRWLLDGLVAHLDRGEVTLPLLFVLVCLLGPLIWAWWWRCLVLRKVQLLYDDIIKEKDAEILRIQKVCGGRALPSPSSPPTAGAEKLPSSRPTRR